jgi:predicted enzyme related to lactoylglutathione lyase
MPAAADTVQLRPPLGAKARYALVEALAAEALDRMIAVSSRPRLLADSRRQALEGVMHRSRLAGFIIDCRTEDLQAAASFWGQALGMKVRRLPGEEDKYIQLVDPTDRLHIEVQSVSHPSRVHLDIEADDVEAEARRLEALGAKRVQKIHTWWVMQAPTGQKFCVVRARSAAFSSGANEWE